MDENTMVGNYIAYVDSVIKKFDRMGRVANNAMEVTPQSVNTALALYDSVHDGILAEYQRVKAQHEAMEIEYTLWEDEKLSKAKQKVLEEYSGNKSIKPSVKEFEVQMRLDNKEEWKDWKYRITESDAKERFILRLLEKVNRYDKILTTLSANMRSEMMSLSLDRRMNANFNPPPKRVLIEDDDEEDKE